MEVIINNIWVWSSCNHMSCSKQINNTSLSFLLHRVVCCINRFVTMLMNVLSMLYITSICQYSETTNFYNHCFNSLTANLKKNQELEEKRKDKPNSSNNKWKSVIPSQKFNSKPLLVVLFPGFLAHILISWIFPIA